MSSKDELLKECWAEIRSCVQEWTREFKVIHFDREECQEKGWGLDHFDYVVNSQVLCDLLEALIRYERLTAWNEIILSGMADRQNDPIPSFCSNVLWSDLNCLQSPVSSPG